MSNFALVNNGFVENVIVAEEARAVSLLFPDFDLVVEVTAETGHADVGCEFKAGKFIPLKPYDSWSFDEASWQWTAPTPYPETPGKMFAWDESELDWIELVVPTEIA